MKALAYVANDVNHVRLLNPALFRAAMRLCQTPRGNRAFLMFLADSSDPGELHLEQELKPHKAPFPMSVFVPRPHLSVGGACGLSVGTPLSGAPRHRAFPTLTEEAEGKAQGSAATAVMTRALQLVRSASNGVRRVSLGCSRGRVTIRQGDLR